MIFVRNINGEITNIVVRDYIVMLIILFLQTQQSRVNLYISDNVLALQIPVQYFVCSFTLDPTMRS